VLSIGYDRPICYRALKMHHCETNFKYSWGTLSAPVALVSTLSHTLLVPSGAAAAYGYRPITLNLRNGAS